MKGLPPTNLSWNKPALKTLRPFGSPLFAYEVGCKYIPPSSILALRQMCAW